MCLLRMAFGARWSPPEKAHDGMSEPPSGFVDSRVAKSLRGEAVPPALDKSSKAVRAVRPFRHHRPQVRVPRRVPIGEPCIWFLPQHRACLPGGKARPAPLHRHRSRRIAGRLARYSNAPAESRTCDIAGAVSAAGILRQEQRRFFPMHELRGTAGVVDTTVFRDWFCLTRKRALYAAFPAAGCPMVYKRIRQADKVFPGFRVEHNASEKQCDMAVVMRCMPACADFEGARRGSSQ